MTFALRSIALAVAIAATAMLGFTSDSHAGSAGAAVGGFVGGLIVGGALNPNRPPTYSPAPVYVVPAQPRCYWQTERYYDPYRGWLTRRVQVCS